MTFNMEEEPSFFLYYCSRILMKTFYFLFYIPILIMYWGKGKTVPPIKNDLLLKSATELAAEIRSGKLKSEFVVQTYIERIKEVEPFINAVVEHRFEEAIEKAKEVDVLVASKNISEERLKKEKPLLGVPFTIKILIQVKGLTLSAGTALFEDEKASEDARTVAQLKNAGGIFLATTNTPAFGFAIETHNLLYGITKNPYDNHRTAGGSSGGESAILAAAGSVIGLGNDYGGSIRIPAQFTGIFSHKASKGMVSNEGSSNILRGKARDLLFTGPMTRYPEDLITVMKVLTTDCTERIQFDRSVDFKNLKIFYQLNTRDAKMESVDEEIQWAIKRAARYFRDTHGVLPQEVNIKLLNFSSDICQHIILDHIPDIPGELSAGKIKNWRILPELMKYIIGRSDLTFTSIFNFYMSSNPVFFNKKNIPLNQQRLQILREEFDHLLDENSVLFYPTTPSSARRHFAMIPLIMNGVYSAIFNVLGLPVTQCPLGLNKNGLPLGMQIVGKMNNDSLTLACAKELSKAFGGWTPPR